MGMDAYATRDTAPVWHHIVKLLGTGASAPTKQEGYGITVTRTGAGVYKLTWAENPGKYVGFVPGLQAATPGDIAGHTVVADTYDTSTKSMEVCFFDGSNAAHDLAANEWIHLDITFRPWGP